MCQANSWFDGAMRPALLSRAAAWLALPDPCGPLLLSPQLPTSAPAALSCFPSQPASPWFLVVARPTLSVEAYPRQVRPAAHPGTPAGCLRPCKHTLGSPAESQAPCRALRPGAHSSKTTPAVGSLQADLAAFRIPHGVFVKMHKGTWHAGGVAGARVVRTARGCCAGLLNPAASLSVGDSTSPPSSPFAGPLFDGDGPFDFYNLELSDTNGEQLTNCDASRSNVPHRSHMRCCLHHWLGVRHALLLGRAYLLAYCPPAASVPTAVTDHNTHDYGEAEGLAFEILD